MTLHWRSRVKNPKPVHLGPKEEGEQVVASSRLSPLCGLLAGAACTGPRGTAGAPQPTTERSLREVWAGVGMDGRLEGDPQRGCLWLVDTLERPAVSLICSEDFEVRRDPLRVVGPDGQVEARRGDFLSLGGVKQPTDRSTAR